MFQEVASLLRTPYKGELCSSFFQVVELQLCTRAVCGMLLLETLPMKDVSENYMHSLLALQAMMQLLFWDDRKKQPHLCIKQYFLTWPLFTASFTS